MGSIAIFTKEKMNYVIKCKFEFNVRRGLKLEYIFDCIHSLKPNGNKQKSLKAQKIMVLLRFMI